ncbi:MAG: lyase family protein, partial [Candidatus Hodarchaeota archaeon]
MKNFNLFSPTDYRYSIQDLKDFLSEEAFTKYKIKVEIAIIKTFAKYKLCSDDIVHDVQNILDKISTDEIYNKEQKLKHEIQALVQLIKSKVHDKAKPYIHLTATSHDIINIANALRYKHAIKKIILPDMIRLEKIWIKLAREEKNTLQIGRTHGQHAEPITFGFFIAQYVDRWGIRILKLKEYIDNLSGKFNGAVGAYNALSLILEDPKEFEADLLKELGLNPVKISSQIIPPEQMTDVIHYIISSWGILANYADDMRHLQRSEIGEIMEQFDKDQIGSSTMPHKRNPINFENIKSSWKKFMPNMITIYMNQISEHQGDLTNSLSQRYIPELIVMFSSSVKR